MNTENGSIAHSGPVLDRRALNRALLARQMLLERSSVSAGAAIQHLVGMQAQAPDQPYVGLLARLIDFRPEPLSRMVERRLAVRMSLMRATIHLTTTRDALRLRPLLQPTAASGLFASSPWLRHIRGADLKEVTAAGRSIMGERPRTIAELARLMAPRFPGHEGLALAYAVRSLVPLVFVPPRGTWGGRGAVSLTTVEAYLGRPLAAPMPATELARRYLGAFGPASAADARAWSGLSVAAALEKLRPRLITFRDQRGRELFDLPRAPRPGPDVEAPPRFLPDYDNLLLAHDDRARIMAPGQHLGLFSPQGVMKGSVLVDGFLCGMWLPKHEGGATHLMVTPFEKAIPRRERPAIEEEGERLLELLAPGQGDGIRFRPPRS